MKGLLTKDFYMLIKNCRYFALLVAVFMVVGVFSNDNSFMSIYPSVITGVLPITLYSYDERERWNNYAVGLPVKRSDVISSKYIIGLLICFVVTILMTISYAIKLFTQGASGVGLSFYIVSLLGASLVSPSILMPFNIKYGVEKGRIAYLLVIGIICGALSLFSFASEDINIKVGFSPLLIVGAVIIIYAVSWIVSVKIFEKKDL